MSNSNVPPPAMEARLITAALVASSNAVLITDVRGVILWTNPALSALTGYGAGELQGAKPSLFKSNRHDAAFYSRLWGTITRGQTWNAELWNRRKSGELFYAAHTITPIRDATGRIANYVGIMHDLSERRAREERITAAENRLATVLDSAPVIVYSVAYETSGKRVSFVSPNITRILGYTVDEAMNPSWWGDVVHPEDIAVAQQGEETLRRVGRNRTEYRVKHRIGHDCWIEDTQRLVPGQAGAPDQLFGAWTDITEQKRWDERQRASEMRYAALFRLSQFPVAFSTLDTGRFIDANPEFLRFFGYNRDEVIGHTSQELRMWEDPSQREKLRDELRRGGRAVNVEAKARTRSGALRTVLISFELLDFSGEKLLVSSIVDLTERRLLQEQLFRAQRMESLGRLASGIAHDLNNILAPIVIAGSLLRGSSSPSESEEILQVVEKSAERGAALVRHLLAFGRGAAGRFAPLRIREVLHEVVAMIKPTFPKNITIDVDAPRELWLLDGDSTQLNQVILNFCVNARDAMPQGGRLAISAQNRILEAADVQNHPGAAPGPYVVLRVADTGTGISRENLEHLFEPFFTTKESGKGTGLGLSIAAGVVKNHGGFITCETAPGAGTTFSTFLPARPESVGSTPAPVSSVSARGNSEFILVAEDEDRLRMVIRETLLRHNYRLLCAHDGAEAVALFTRQAGEIDLVICDSDMPQLDGRAVYERVRALKPNQAFILVTGSLERLGDHAAAAAAGDLRVDAVLQKPFSSEQLLATVTTALARHR